MKIVYTLMTLLVVAVIAFWIRSGHKETTTATTTPLPNIAQAYTLYTNDKETDVYGSSRTYVRADIQPEWVLLSCSESVGTFSLVTGNNFKSRIGFNPKTGEGVWSIEYPTKGLIQTGKVQVAPNSYGGYEILFTYDDGNTPCKGRLAPI